MKEARIKELLDDRTMEREGNRPDVRGPEKKQSKGREVNISRTKTFATTYLDNEVAFHYNLL